MATDTVHKQEFRIRDLATRSVLLFPTRAQVIRDIKEITLQPGANQIIIDGLAPTVDEHSIKVEGTGSATITEVTVDLLPNREVYEDIYPSDSEDDDDDEDDESDEEAQAMTVINDKIKKLNISLLDDQEKINSAANRLQICDNFGKSVEKTRPPPENLNNVLNAYREEREKIYRDHEATTASAEKVREEIRKAEKEKTKLAKELVKANEKKEKEKAKLKEKKLRKKAEIYKEKQRIKAERESFWPKKVYCVTIKLEPSSLTPASSRRGSIDGDTIVNLATSDFHEPSKEPLKTGQINLSLSYITYSASWSPRYDLSLNTLKCNGVLDYGAELKNTTSETWRDAKVILSTSQTSFSGLSETIPTLHPWHVRLLKGGRNTDSALFSQNELQAKQKEWSSKAGGDAQKPRYEVFGRDNSTRDTWFAEHTQKSKMKKSARDEQVQQVISNHSQAMPQAFGSVQASTAPGNSLFGSSSNTRGFAARSRAVEPNNARFASVPAMEYEECDEDDMGFGPFDGNVEPQSLVFEEGAWEESGMTTTYDVPGFKTLAPSNSTIKHKIAKIDFKNIIFSHIVIGKLRQVAFLKARLRNASKITLLKGPLGLTLDGSFLGQASFPRCSAGESFSLPLGVDPAITISMYNLFSLFFAYSNGRIVLRH